MRRTTLGEGALALTHYQSTMSNRHKDWLVQEQTALGKDFSNPKIVWLSNHHI
ncbi:hypothetical protein Tco_0224762, partial [Tanacetum coccineum]